MKFPISEDTQAIVTCTARRTRCGWAAPQPRSFVAMGALLLFLTLTAQAQLIVNFTTIADTTTAIPEGTGNFVAIPVDPCVWFRNVAFGGIGSGGQQGLYVCAPTDPCKKIADQNTPIPDGAGMFTSPTDPCIYKRNVAFLGNGDGQQGIYVSFDGALHKIADLNSPIPNGAKGSISSLHCSSGTITILGKSASL